MGRRPRSVRVRTTDRGRAEVAVPKSLHPPWTQGPGVVGDQQTPTRNELGRSPRRVHGGRIAVANAERRTQVRTPADLAARRVDADAPDPPAAIRDRVHRREVDRRRHVDAAGEEPVARERHLARTIPDERTTRVGRPADELAASADGEGRARRRTGRQGEG